MVGLLIWGFSVSRETEKEGGGRLYGKQIAGYLASCYGVVLTQSDDPFSISVAVLSSSTFDATTVDASTVLFGGISPLNIGASPEDVNNDGLLDRVFHYDTTLLNVLPGDTVSCVSGSTTSGENFEGCDSIRIVKF